MLFNTFTFGYFLVASATLYWTLFNRRRHLRNAFLLVASYLFYACWDWRFLFLIAAVTLTDFLAGRLIGQASSQRARRATLVAALVLNLGTLGFFKYYNFFIDSANALLGLLGLGPSLHTLHIILPVGISFFTFQGLGYVIDIYRRQLQPTRDPVAFAAFIAFFPQLVAGPIERARNLLPQFLDPAPRKPFDYDLMRRGLLLIAWGYYKKVILADRLAIYVDNAYANPVDGLPTLIASLFFCFQLYLDFSAYSQIAVGTARLFGFRLSTNFRRPYLATSFRNFWQRWHISLSSWFRDYLYLPLGGNRRSTARTILNTLIVFILSGLWHGASWNFAIWGILNGLALLLFDRLLKLNPKSLAAKIPTAILVTLVWGVTLVFFRTGTLADALGIFANWGFGNADRLFSFGLCNLEFIFTWIIMLILWVAEITVEASHGKAKTLFYSRSMTPLRWFAYLFLVLSVIYFGIYGNGSDNSFIYFQF